MKKIQSILADRLAAFIVGCGFGGLFGFMEGFSESIHSSDVIILWTVIGALVGGVGFVIFGRKFGI